MSNKKIDHVLAFYLPQFHPIKDNNNWWGKGFTEWRNVTLSKPRFSGHRQPQIPADLGFYDLRLEQTREEQAQLAKEYGITGFCYYHYWFNGHRLLEQPLNEVLKNRNPDFPFCICWANENWTRAWDGMEKEVLIKQEYTEDDANNHIQSLIELFKDTRYIKIEGKPLLLIYRYDHIPNVADYFATWRREVAKHGISDLYICAVKNSFIQTPDEEILAHGFDAIVDFQPNRADFPVEQSIKQKTISYLRKVLPDSIYQLLKVNSSVTNRISYNGIVENKLSQHWPSDYIKYPAVFPSWDNSPRRKTPTVIQNNDPKMYEKWLTHAIGSTSQYDEGKRLVFINAWNEWAEGCHLEPDLEMGHTFLESTKKVLDKFK